MRFVSEPPCAKMDLKLSEKDRLELTISGSERLSGGVAATVGGVFASVALRMVRAPLPGPFKLISLAAAGVGAAVGTAGAFTAAVDYTITVTPTAGVCFRWKWGPFEPKEVTVAPDAIENLEVVRSMEPSSSSRGLEVESFRLMLVTKTGTAHAIERFETHTQARLRRSQIESVLSANKAPGEGWLG
jgi:hypothetical protein